MNLPPDVISSLYAAAAGRTAWREPFDRLSEALGLWCVQAVGVDKRTGGLIFSAEGGPASAAAAIDYIRFYHASNPRLGPAVSTPFGQWMHCHKYFDNQYVASSPFYQDFLIPYGGRYMSATKFVDNDEVVFMLGIFRGYGSEPICDSEMPLLEEARHHFAAAFANATHLRQTFAELGAAREMLNHLPYAMLLVDEARGIWHRNAAGDQLLREGQTIREQGGFVVCGDSRSNDDLTAAIHGITEADFTSGSRRRAVTLRSTHGPSLLAFVSGVRPDQAMGVFGKSPRVLITLYDPSQATSIDPFIIAECFNLTPAEARVAVEIASGTSAKQIAQHSGAALPTIRTHIQRVMEKTGVNRQTDLLRTLLALPIRT